MSSYNLSPYKVITIIEYILYKVHYITVTYLFYNWKFLPLNTLHLFHANPHNPFFWQQPLCSLYLWGSFCFVVSSFVFYLDCMYKWDHMVFVIVCLSYFIYHNTLKVHPCFHKWEDTILFLWLRCVSFFMTEMWHMTEMCPFIYQWTLTTLPYCGYCK